MKAAVYRSILTIALLAIALGSSTPATRAASEHHHIWVTGVKEVAGHPARVDLLIEVPAGAGAAELAREALAIEQARPVDDRVSADFTLNTMRWRQFFDANPNNDFVLQYYNPEGDPTPGGAERALLSTQQEWTDVPTATFAFKFGGTTTAGLAFDGVNTVSWPTFWWHGSLALGIAVSVFDPATGFVLDADVEMNPNFQWFDPADVMPCPVPPPRGAVCPVGHDVRVVLLHENGHVAGLEHSPVRGAIMHPSNDFVAAGQIGPGLAQDDIDAISALYPFDFIRVPAGRFPLPEPSPNGPPPQVGVIARLGDVAPSRASDHPSFPYFYDFDFEPYGLNDRGQVAFAADFFPDMFGTIETPCCEGAFLAAGPETLVLARSGEPAPGGRFFGQGVWFGIGLNEQGDAAFSFGLAPFELPFGLNSGVYRYSQVRGTLEPVVVPGVTPSPSGQVFVGAFDGADLNTRGDVAFAGIIETEAGITPPFGMGVFVSDSHGQIRAVAAPGDPAPGGGVFDFAAFPSINDAGDIAFGAHVRGEECLTGVSQTRSIHCDESLYLRRASGETLSIVHQGDPAPGGGTFRSILAPVINSRGEILFIGDLTPPPGRRRDLGIFLYTGGQVVPIALPGQELPGGGRLVTSATQPGNWDLNNLGEVAFSAMLDTDTLGFGTNDTGLYVWSDGTLQVIARTGMEFPELGTVLRLGPPEINQPFSGALINARGDIVFNATFIGPNAFVTALLKAETR